MLRLLAWTLLALASGTVLFELAARAAAARQRSACPFDDEDPVPRAARFIASVRTFVGECGARLLVTLAWPLALLPARRTRSAGRPVVLVHDPAHHRASVAWLARRLRRDGRVPHRVPFGTVSRDVERSGARLAAAIEAVRHAAGAEAVDVLAHGVGGLVVRAALRGGVDRVHRVITLGTPHQGTRVSTWLVCDPIAPCRDARVGSPLLRRLAFDDPVPARTDFVAIHSTDDARVVPAGNGYYPGAFNVEVAGYGHLALLFSSRIWELVRENLAASDAPHAAVRA